MFANELALAGERLPEAYVGQGRGASLATIGGAKGLKIDGKTGSLTPGKDADVILLDATALNVAPLNHAAGAVVTLMDRSNVSTVLCAGQIKKWRGSVLGHDIRKLRSGARGKPRPCVRRGGNHAGPVQSVKAARVGERGRSRFGLRFANRIVRVRRAAPLTSSPAQRGRRLPPAPS